MSSAFATLPAPPYYVVCFSSQRTKDDDHGYETMADAMVALARQQPGFLGIETARDADGFGISNSYWKDETSIQNWKKVVDHRAAQSQGRAHWYSHYEMRVAKVERAYGFDKVQG